MRRLPLRSPPRVRGKDPPAAAMQGCPGITPACAGKSHSVTDANASSWDHPRVCGEKMQTPTPSSGGMGSPPRMRGKVYKITPPWFSIRITPAYAGKRAWFSYCGCQDRDHPRVCGEKFYVDEVLPGDTGSPPRMRGKVCIFFLVTLSFGITPACAGKSFLTGCSSSSARDHPRVCGEKRTTAGRSSGACAATSNAIGMVTSALYRSAMSYTKEHSCPTCTNPSPGAHPSATMTAWASPYRQACTVGHTGAGAEQQHRNARHSIHGCFLRAGWSSGQGRRLCRGQCPDTASPGTLPGRSPAGCPHRSPPAM